MAFTVLVEDTAAMIGLAIALLGIASADALDSPRLDAAAAVLIGVFLGAVGLVLAYKCKELLIGESVEAGVLASIRAIAEADPAVARLVRALTMHFGPADVLLTRLRVARSAFLSRFAARFSSSVFAGFFLCSFFRS